MLLQICMGFLGLKDIVKSVNNQNLLVRKSMATGNCFFPNIL